MDIYTRHGSLHVTASNARKWLVWRAGNDRRNSDSRQLGPTGSRQYWLLEPVHPTAQSSMGINILLMEIGLWHVGCQLRSRNLWNDHSHKSLGGMIAYNYPQSIDTVEPVLRDHCHKRPCNCLEAPHIHGRKSRISLKSNQSPAKWSLGRSFKKGSTVQSGELSLLRLRIKWSLYFKTTCSQCSARKIWS